MERHADVLRFTAWRDELEFELPEPPPEVRVGWQRWLETALSAADDIRPLAEASPVRARTYRLVPHSMAAVVGVSSRGEAAERG